MAQKIVRVKPVLGWREWIKLPQLGLAIKAKVDTGAKSSSLHAFDIEYFGRSNKRMVRFRVHPVQRETATTVVIEAPLQDQRKVRSSTGEAKVRPVIVTPLQIAGEAWPIELTLATRDMMGFRMLIGREAVRRRYLIDPGRSFLMGAPLTRKDRSASG